MAFPVDRRKRKRVSLHWPVRLLQPGRPSVVTSTENISSEGFYCNVKQPFRIGERLQCEIMIPGESFGLQEPTIRLRCQVTVRRVESSIKIDAFGLGCHIEDYALITDSPSRAM